MFSTVTTLLNKFMIVFNLITFKVVTLMYQDNDKTNEVI